MKPLKSAAKCRQKRHLGAYYRILIEIDDENDDDNGENFDV